MLDLLSHSAPSAKGGVPYSPRVPTFLPLLSQATADARYVRKNALQVNATDFIRLGAAPGSTAAINVDAASYASIISAATFNVTAGGAATLSSDLTIGPAALFHLPNIDATNEMYFQSIGASGPNNARVSLAGTNLIKPVMEWYHAGGGIGAVSVNGTLTVSGAVTLSGTNPLILPYAGNADIHMSGGGTFRVLNQAYSTPLFSVTNAGAFTIPGTLGVTGAAGINGKAPVANVAAPPAAGAAYGATEQTLLNDIRTRLINFGIYT